MWVTILCSPGACFTYLPSWVDFQDFLGFMLPFLEGQEFPFVSLQPLFLQGDHDTPAGGGSSPPQQTHGLGHVSRYCRRRLAARKARGSHSGHGFKGQPSQPRPLPLPQNTELCHSQVCVLLQRVRTRHFK